MRCCIIPARGGSQRIPKKNIKSFCGSPLISFAISLARKSNLFDKVVVSTDDKAVKNLSIELGADFLIDRPARLADNTTPTHPVILHAISIIEKQIAEVDQVMCLYPGVPLLMMEDLVKALDVWNLNRERYVIAVAEFPSKIQRALLRNSAGNLISVDQKWECARTQDLETTYFDAGQFYYASTNVWKSNPSLHNNAVGVTLPRLRAVDLDTPEDWADAEFLFRAIKDGY